MSIKANNNLNHIYKIVIAGPAGVGKTQATNVLSDNEVMFTEASTSEPTSSDKNYYCSDGLWRYELGFW